MKNSIKRILRLLAFVAVGVLIGFASVFVFASVPSVRESVRDIAGEGIGIFMLWWLGFMLLLAAAALFHIVIHEAGHLLFGLMSGYRFVSFRIGSFVLVRDDEGFRLGRFSIAGTGGQCLLDPPAMTDGRFPYKLYYMGGVAVNLLAAAISAAIAVSCDGIGAAAAVVLLAIAITGTFIGLLNGIPMKIGGMPNDGYNLFAAGREPQTLRSLWIQLKVNVLQTRGERLRDMPAEWFEVPENADLGNYMYAAVAGLAVARLFDDLRIAEARPMLQRMAAADSGSIAVYRMGVACESAFVEIMTGGSAESVAEILTPEVRRYAEVYSRYMLSCVRLLYVHARFVEHDAAKADELYAKAVKMAPKSPNKGDTASEMELIEYCRAIEKV